jgi:hypothetical protein
MHGESGRAVERVQASSRADLMARSVQLNPGSPLNPLPFGDIADLLRFERIVAVEHEHGMVLDLARFKALEAASVIAALAPRNRRVAVSPQARADDRCQLPGAGACPRVNEQAQLKRAWPGRLAGT